MNYLALKLNLNKKGDLPIPSYKLLMWIPSFLFTIIVIAVTFYIILSFIITTTNVSEAESNILTDSAYYSDKGFSYVDPTTGRVYTGVVNVSKFTTDSAKKLFGHEKPLIVGRFVKKQVAVDRLLNPESDMVVYTDEARYKHWQPIAQVEGEGEGGKTPYPEVRYITTTDGEGAFVETVFIASG